MHIERRYIGPGTATKILVLDTHGRAGTAVLCGVFAPAGLNARLLAGGHDEPCLSVYGDLAQVMPSSELLAAINGFLIGAPFDANANGEVRCNGSSGGVDAMIPIPSQGVSPAITDMHNKPCLLTTADPRGCAPDVGVSKDTFSAVWDFLYYNYYQYQKTNHAIFGETWSNSAEECNSYPDTDLTQAAITGYQQSCLASTTTNNTSASTPQGSGCYVNGAQQQFGTNPTPSSVVFRPWGQVGPNAPCETPLRLGPSSDTAQQPNGPFKIQQP
jgi:hypothetical protein